MPRGHSSAATASSAHGCEPGALATPTSSQGTKDLIVRLLAEVFHVASQAGQVKWQQVSDSLVPISVYSRTSRVWLHHWLQRMDSHSAATAALLYQHQHQHNHHQDCMIFQIVAHQPIQNCTTSYHRQQQHQTNNNNNTNNNNKALINQTSTNYIKLLDVRVVQPGTRLGQASEYFIYWKDHRLDKTWGLNFGTTQDARQFYDICTLNLANLNPNLDSQFFKNILHYQQQQQRHQQQQPQFSLQTDSQDRRLSSHHGATSTNDTRHQSGRSLEPSNQPYLRHSTSYHALSSHNQQPQKPAPCFTLPASNSVCSKEQQQQQHQQTIARLRSRSTSRHKSQQQARFEHQQHQVSMGSRSTPASPARRQTGYHQLVGTSHDSSNSIRHHPQCSMLLQHASATSSNGQHHRHHHQHHHQQQKQHQNARWSQQQQSLDQQSVGANSGILRMRSMSSGNKQANNNNNQQQHQVSMSTAARSVAPMVNHKLSSGSLANREHQQNKVRAPPVPPHQSSITSSLSLHSKREGRVRYMGNVNQHQHMMRPTPAAAATTAEAAAATTTTTTTTMKPATTSAQFDHQPSAHHVHQAKDAKHQHNVTLDHHQHVYNQQCPVHHQQQHQQKVSRQQQHQQHQVPVPVRNSSIHQQEVYLPGSDGQSYICNCAVSATSQPGKCALVPHSSPRQQQEGPFDEVLMDQPGGGLPQQPQHHQCNYWPDNNLPADGSNDSVPPPVQPRTSSHQQTKLSRGAQPAASVVEPKSVGGLQPQQAQIHRSRSHQQPAPPIDSSFSISSNSSHTHARNARMARAQYARSRNQNEFRSLDVGGMQPTQAQIDIINENLRHHHRLSKQQQKHLTASTNGDRLLLPEDASRDASIDSNDKQPSVIKSRSTDDMRNVATTTDDLPMDPQTLKRMLILSSHSTTNEGPSQPKVEKEATVSQCEQQQTQKQQEQQQVVSEKLHMTQERRRAATLSALTDSSLNQRGRYLDRTSPSSMNNSGRNSQNRALSLGLDSSDFNRGRAARSDTGRRRSLERTSCVDFDSPAPQLNVAHQLGAARQSPMAPSSRLTTTHGQSPLASGGAAGAAGCITFRQRVNLDMSHQEAPMEYDDGAIVCDNDHEMLHDYEERIRRALELDMLENTQQQLQSSSLRRRNNNVKQAGDQKSFHSCPSSLRKKKQLANDSNHPNSQYNQYRLFYLSELDLNQSLGATLRRRPSELDSHYPYDYEDLYAAGNFPYHDTDYDDDLGIGILNTSSLDINGGYVPDASFGRQARHPCDHEEAQDTPGQHDRHHQQKIVTRASSRCSSTNCKYGLYDSDEDEGDVDLEDSNEADEGFQICSSKEDDILQQVYSSPISEHATNSRSRIASTTNTTYSHMTEGVDGQRGRKKVRPVDLYDQTMMRYGDKTIANNNNNNNNDRRTNNRSSGSGIVKERRSRSQPPPIEVLLSRSMENVEKLMQEVQDELDSIRRGEGYARLKQRCVGASKEAEASESLDQKQKQYQHHQTRQRGGLNYSDSEANPPSAARGKPPGKRVYRHDYSDGDDKQQPIYQKKTIFRRLQQPLSSSDNEATSTSRGRRPTRGAIEAPDPYDDENNNNNNKMSNEERLSMGHRQHPYQTDYSMESQGTGATHDEDRERSATKKAAKFKCTGAVRKAGFLSVKKWILKRRQSIELARKRGWKRYWVCLRGTTLLFHSLVDTITTPVGDPMDSRYKNIGSCTIETEPRHLIIVDGSIAQPVPEHPKRDHVFCLSTTFGDAYLFQSSCQLESDNWIGAIHNACAASLARDQGRRLTMRLISSQIDKLSVEAELQTRLRHRLEMRLSSMLQSAPVSVGGHDAGDGTSSSFTSGAAKSQQQKQLIETRAQLCQQLQFIYVNLEQLHCESYQLRCYLASCKGLPTLAGPNMDMIDTTSTPASLQQQVAGLSGVELPHPKTLLMHVSMPTKLILNKLGVFTVSSFHAYVCARAGGPCALMNHLHCLLRTSSTASATGAGFRARSLSTSASVADSQRNRQVASAEGAHELASVKHLQLRLAKSLLVMPQAAGNGTTLNGEDGQDSYISLSVPIINDDINTHQLLCLAFNQAPLSHMLGVYLNPCDYFVQLVRTTSQQDNYIPGRKESYNHWPSHDHIQVEKKITYQIRLTRESLTQRFGFSVEAQLVEQNSLDELCVFCSRIEANSPADGQGLKIDDVIVIINGAQVSDLDMMFIENTLQEELSLVMVIKSCRMKMPDSALKEGAWDPGNNLTFARGSSPSTSQRRVNDKDGQGRQLDGDDHHDGHQWPSRGTKAPNNLDQDDHHHHHHHHQQQQQQQQQQKEQQQQSNYNLISDEYIASLVCPPPPRITTTTTSTTLNGDCMDRATGLYGGSKPMGMGLLNQAVANGNETLTDNNKALKTDHHTTRDHAVNNLDQSHLKRTKLEEDNTIERNGTGNVGLGRQTTTRRPVKQEKPVIPEKPSHVKEAMRSLKANHSHSPPAKAADLASMDKKVVQVPGTTNVERLRKSILEILETERTYVDHLSSVLSLYMEPLKGADYLQVDDIRLLFNTITDIASFQRSFQQNLEQEVIQRAWKSKATNKEATQEAPNNEAPGMIGSLSNLGTHLLMYNSVEDFSDILLGVADTFLSYADKFKLYSTFCASYSKLQKLLHPTSVHQSNSATSLLNDTFASNVNSTFFSHQSSSSSAISANSQAFIYAHKLNEFFVNLTSSLAAGRAIKSQQRQANSSNDTNTNANSNSSSSSSSSNAPTIKKHQHQQNFESYLIKPIQRIVKYPLLISSLVHLANTDSFEHKQLSAAMKQMEQVAGHINDMQRIHEEYGFIFDHLQRQYGQQQQQHPMNEPQQSNNGTQSTGTGLTPAASGTASSGSPVDLNVGELLYYGGVDWLNMHEFSGKVKKSQELHPIVFVFSSAVVFLCKERIRQKKKLSMPLTTNKLSDVVEIIRYQALIPVSEVQVRSLPASDGSSKQNLAKELKQTASSTIVESASSQSLTTVSSKTAGGNPLQVASSEMNKVTSQPASFQWELFKCCPANVNAGLLVNAGLRRADGKVYLFSNSNNELRNAFLRKIRFIIRESVRNMNVPLARSPSSKSTSSKKLTSSSSSSSSVSSPLAPLDKKKEAINQQIGKESNNSKESKGK